MDFRLSKQLEQAPSWILLSLLFSDKRTEGIIPYMMAKDMCYLVLCIMSSNKRVVVTKIHVVHTD